MDGAMHARYCDAMKVGTPLTQKIFTNRLSVQILILIALLLLCAPLKLAEGSAGHCFGAGYDLMGLHDLVVAASKYDGQPVWTVGTIRFTDGVPQLEDYDLSSAEASKAQVCLQTVSEQVRILRQLKSLSVGVLGIYKRTTPGASKSCPNGTITVQAVHISFE